MTVTSTLIFPFPWKCFSAENSAYRIADINLMFSDVMSFVYADWRKIAEQDEISWWKLEKSQQSSFLGYLWFQSSNPVWCLEKFQDVEWLVEHVEQDRAKKGGYQEAEFPRRVGKEWASFPRRVGKECVQNGGSFEILSLPVPGIYNKFYSSLIFQGAWLSPLHQVLNTSRTSWWASLACWSSNSAWICPAAARVGCLTGVGRRHSAEFSKPPIRYRLGRLSRTVTVSDTRLRKDRN